MSNKVYDQIISVGSNCEITWNLRSYFKHEKAYPFDWLITHQNSIVETVRTDFHDLLNIDNLSISADRRTIRCNKFNMLHHHDFERDENDLIRDDIERQIPSLRAKYTMLIARLYDSCRSGNILLVRNRGEFDKQLLDWKIDQDFGIARILALFRSRFASAEFSMLATNLGRTGIDKAEQVIWDCIHDYGDCNEYQGSTKGWTELFQRHSLELRGA